MVIFKSVSLFLGIFIYILTAASLHLFLFLISSRLRLRLISYWTRVFNKFLRLIFRIKIVITGERKRLNENGNFIISNHLSYLDGIVLASLFPVVFVSKSEVKSWPLFGLMTRAAGTIFIDRKRKHKSLDYIRQSASVLKNKVNVLTFPEGTSTNGERLLDFQPVHFESPLIAGSAILPVTVYYTKINGLEVDSENRNKVCWYGQMKFVPHLLELMRLNNIEVKVIIHPRIELNSQATSCYSRKQLSESLHEIISAGYPLFKNK